MASPIVSSTHESSNAEQDHQRALLTIAKCKANNHDYLILSGLQIDSFIASIGILKNLQAFCGINLGLTSIPEALCELPKLERLCLASNKIAALTPSLIKLTALKELHLQENQLLATHSVVELLGKLEYLDLQNNRLVEFSLDTGHMYLLQQLHLENNKLTSIWGTIFSKNSFHLTIWLQGNPLGAAAIDTLSTQTKSGEYQGPLIYFKS